MTDKKDEAIRKLESEVKFYTDKLLVMEHRWFQALLEIAQLKTEVQGQGGGR